MAIHAQLGAQKGNWNTALFEQCLESFTVRTPGLKTRRLLGKRVAP
jgi:hypothetical protein